VDKPSVQSEIVTYLRVAGLIDGVILLGGGLVMLGVRLHADLAWERAEARIDRVGVICDLKWVELRFSRNAYRPHYRTLPCSDVAGFQAQHPEINATIKEVTTVEVRFISATGSDVRASGRHSPHGWRAPSVGETVPITYNPANPSEIAWGGAAMSMYLAGGIIALAGAGLTWLGWPSSRPTTRTMPPAGPGHAAEAFATRPPNRNGSFGRRTRVQSR
jgi:hypothetical protein